jgi:hypothetical protein
VLLQDQNLDLIDLNKYLYRFIMIRLVSRGVHRVIFCTVSCPALLFLYPTLSFPALLYPFCTLSCSTCSVPYPALLYLFCTLLCPVNPSVSFLTTGWYMLSIFFDHSIINSCNKLSNSSYRRIYNSWIFTEA